MPGLNMTASRNTTKEKATSSSSADMFALLRRDFALHCRTLRANLKLSQRNFAVLMGVKNEQGKITVSRWESGRIRPQNRFLQKFMEIQNQYDSKRSQT